MSERPIKWEEIRNKVKELTGVVPKIAALNRSSPSFVDLSDTEREIVEYVFNSGLNSLKKVAPSVAAELEWQRELALIFAAIAKATFPVRKNYTYPSTPGNLGVTWLFPQALKWVATPNADNPCYTSYAANSWDISVTAGTPAYLLGDGTNFYRTSRATDRHSFILIFHNGVIEVGSTPTIDQFRLWSESKTDYGVYSVQPLVDVPIEKNVAIYMYPTPLGALPIDYNTGVMWSFMPRTSGVKTIKLLGLVFYEHDFASTLKWSS